MYVKYGRAVGGKNSSVFAGVGSSSAPYQDPTAPDTADLNFEGVWAKTTATSGTTRGIYWRLYLDSGAGGETIRAFTTVGSNTPADTVNGAHLSLSFGASTGNVTGLGTAARHTLHVPDRTLGGTVTSVMAEIWADGTSSDVSNASFIRTTLDGDATGVAAIDTHAFFFDAAGLTSGSGNVFYVHAPTTLAASLRVKVGSTTYYLPLYSTQ